MYSYKTIVRYSETGGNLTSNIASIANYFQDCAIMQSEDVGTGIAYLAEHKRAWFLVSWQIEVDRYPRMGETIQVRTWAYHFRASMGFRNIDIIDESGNRIVYAASVWSYVDTETMRPTKIEPEMANAYPMEPKIEMEYAPRKILLFDTYEMIDTRKVMVYQMDSNNHMNNAAYIALAQEYMEDQSEIKAVRAEYRLQFKKNDIIVVKRAENGRFVQILLCDESNVVRGIVQFEKNE